MSKQTLQSSDLIVGRALPYSVYGADKMLLLAKGQVVTERIRDALLRNGVWASHDPDQRPAAEEDRVERPPPCPLQLFRNQYSKTLGSGKIGFRMSRDDRSESFTSWVIGTHEQRGLILSAPVSRDNSLVAVADGQTWIFRALHGTAAFRFAGIVRKVVFEPFPYFHLQLPPAIDMRRVRRRPRASVCIPVSVQLAESVEGVIVDLSSCGMRIAMKHSATLQKGQSLQLRFNITVLDKPYEIQAAATVVCLYGATDSRHPEVHLYGLSLMLEAEFEQMLLHALVQERLAIESDAIWRMLAGSLDGVAPQECAASA